MIPNIIIKYVMLKQTSAIKEMKIKEVKLHIHEGKMTCSIIFFK